MSNDALLSHLKTGATHVCHCWALTRTDGITLGFTDHDQTLEFEGIRFSPNSGLSARALASTSGLSVNNTEAIGVLSDVAITEADIAAGRYDGAAVRVWQVCWDDTEARELRFRGSLGEITRSAGGFQAELHGLTEALNQPQGRSYLKTCNAVLGDARCRFDTSDPAYVLDHVLIADTDGRQIDLGAGVAFPPGWFESGQLEVRSGDAQGLRTVIKTDTGTDTRIISLWSAFGAPLWAGDRIRLTAGCDKRAETCRAKFDNFLNFQGFPDIPGDDWLVSVPRSDKANSGGSLTR